MASAQSPFKELGLAAPLVSAVVGLGYEEPTPVQREAIPLLLTGGDLLAMAATGTGKTAAFALPMIQRLLDDTTPPAKGKGAARRPPTRGLILVPTRELAMQVAEATHKYARGSNLSVVPLYGGASMVQQIRALDRGADIVVATPGRALDHIGRGTLTLSTVSVLVLDEADEMLDMGFAEDIDAILQATPETRQTALFSATMPPRLRAISERHLRKPQRIAIAGEKTAAGKLPRVRQVAYIVRRAHKAAALQRVLDMEEPASAIVFCRTRLEVDTLVETLNAHGYRAEALHGGMQQRQREAVMARVRAATTDLLVATDVAARGIDIEHLSHVVNYDVPAAAEAYVHRIGRTGRAGREGTAITLAEPREHRLLRSIEAFTKQKIEVATVPTVADLRARRLELTAATVRERLVAGDFDDVRVIVESLAQEFDIVDVAAAAVKMAHAAIAGDGEEQDLPDAALRPSRDDSPRGARPSREDSPRGPRGSRDEPARGPRGAAARESAGPSGARERRDPRQERRGGGAVARIFIGAGRRAGIRPGDLVGAIANEAGISARDLGAIQIADAFSLVEVPEAIADEIVAVMRGAKLRGHTVQVRRDRDE